MLLQVGSEGGLLERTPEPALDDEDVLASIRDRRLSAPSAIDTLDERRKHAILDHEDSMLRLGQGYACSVCALCTASVLLNQ